MRFTHIERSTRRGFTIVELLVVVVVASILMGIAYPQLQEAFNRRGASGARDGVLLIAAQGRALAMERARTVEFHLDTDAGTATLVENGAIIETLDFADQFGTTATSSHDAIVLCYTARGYATEPCSTNLGGKVRVSFERGGQTAALEIWQLGQVRKL